MVVETVTRVIQNLGGEYFKSGGAWTANFDDAEKFANTQAALSVRTQFKLSGVSLVLVVHDKPSPQRDVVLPQEG